MSIVTKVATLLLGTAGLEALISKAVEARVSVACKKAVEEAPAKYTFDDAIVELKDPVYRHSVALNLLEHLIGNAKGVELAQLAEAQDAGTDGFMKRRSVVLNKAKEFGLVKSQANLAVELAVFLAK